MSAAKLGRWNARKVSIGTIPEHVGVHPIAMACVRQLRAEGHVVTIEWGRGFVVDGTFHTPRQLQLAAGDRRHP